MKLVTAVIKPHKWEDVREALETFGVTGMTVSEVSGYAARRVTPRSTGGGVRDRPRTEYRIEIVIDDDDAETSSASSSRPCRPAGSATGRSG